MSVVTGAVNWTHPHGFDTPAVFRPRFAGMVMVVGGRHWIAAYDAGSGAEIWRYIARIQTGVPNVTPTGVFLGDGHEVVALDLATGAEMWRFAGIVDTIAAYAPAVSADTVFAGPGDGHIYALSRDDGALRWSRDISGAWQYLRQIAVDGDRLIAGTYKEFLAGVSVADGSTLWTFNAGNFINSQHVVAGSAYLWSPTGWVYAINTATGKVRWRHRTTDYNESETNWASVLAEIVRADDHLFVLSMDDVLHVLDTSNGAEIAARQVPEPVRHAVLPLTGGDGFAFPTQTGDILLAEGI